METINKTSKEKESPVWFITGCSTGFGHEMARQALERGHRVVVTARDPDSLTNISTDVGDTLILKLDVTRPDQVKEAVKEAEDKFERIDILINNAGIGYFAAVEESEEDEVRKMFEVNVFGLARMIHAVLPGMRKRHSGSIVNISSLAGICSMPALGYYNASKFAVEGLSDALRQEVEPLGIQVMVVEPSGFRTDWAGRSAHESKIQIADYVKTAGLARKHLRGLSGKQAGDPIRAAKAILETVESGHMPHHLLLGSDAYEEATKKLDSLKKEYTSFETVTREADYA